MTVQVTQWCVKKTLYRNLRLRLVHSGESKSILGNVNSICCLRYLLNLQVIKTDDIIPYFFQSNTIISYILSRLISTLELLILSTS